MPVSTKSTVVDSPKALNVFYVWYAELCRRYNTSPLSVVKPAKPKKETILDFVGDRVKAEEWAPILNALKKDMSLHVIAIRSRVECEFLQDIDTEHKVRKMKRRFGSLRTAFILRTMLKSLSCCLRCSPVLTSLQLDGLSIDKDYLQLLVPALELNKTLKILSLRHCPLKDGGCELLCRSLRYASNIEVLDLSGCHLGVQSAEHLAKLINYQQTKRYCECWHHSLRYEDPEVEIMCGLKRLTLNGNAEIGDEGLAHMLEVLADDLWIKAIDLQKCNITDKISGRIIDVVTYNRSLQIVDLRHNSRLSALTVDKVFEILKTRQQYDLENDYHWCLTTSTLSFTSDMHNELSRSEFASDVVQKSRSAPDQHRETSRTLTTLRRTKTLAAIKKTKAESQTQKAVLALDQKLKEEIMKRKKVEEQNQELHKKLDRIKSMGNLSGNGALEKCLHVMEGDAAIAQLKSRPKVKLSPIKENAEAAKPRAVNGLIKFVFSPSHRDSAQNIFEKFMSKDNAAASQQEGGGGEEDAARFYDEKATAEAAPSSSCEDEDMSASNVSLLKLVDEINNQIYVTT